MAVLNINRVRAGNELFRLFCSIPVDIYRQVGQYQIAVNNGDSVTARKHIITALSKAKLVRQRIERWVLNNSSSELTSCIDIIVDTVTATEINSEIASIENYCQGLYNDYIAENITLADIATSLVSQYEDILPYIAFTDITGATDIEGNPY
jgi:hypothetical protein